MNQGDNGGTKRTFVAFAVGRAGQIMSQASDVDVIGLRVVHGGAEFREAVRVTPDVEAAIERSAAQPEQPYRHSRGAQTFQRE